MKPLTIQEKRILKLISEGYTTHQIAQGVGISIHAVNAYRNNLLIKLDSKNSVQLNLKTVQLKIVKVYPLMN